MTMNTTEDSSWNAGYHVQDVASNVTTLILWVPLITITLWYSVSYLMSPIRKYPGPFLASWTNLWRMYYAYRGQLHTKTKKLHEKYGPVVRMAPNYLDLDYASLIKTCFDTRGVWRKTEGHSVSGFKVGPRTVYSIFSEVRADEHARIKKPIAKLFTTSGVAPLEPHVDGVVAFFCKQIEKRYTSEDDKKMGQPFDFGAWCMYFSWDAVAKTTMSKRIGYLDHGYDFDGTLHASEKAALYLSTISMNWKLDFLLDKNPIYRIGPPTYTNVAALAVKLLTERYTGKDGHDATKKPDFMDGYIEAKKQQPDIVDDERIVSYLVVNLAAGADTTASALRAIFYFSLKHPKVWNRLQDEILAAPFTQPGTMQLPAPYAQARALPYLDAVIREALRLVPGNVFSQERYVPAGGLQLSDGTYVPEGTAVGFHAYTMHRNKEIWGPDAEEFRPERFFRDEAGGESAEAYRKRMRLYNDSDLTWGAGTRKCIGQNLALVEVFKAVATLVALYEFTLAHPEREWELRAELFPRATGIECRIRKREGMTLREDVDIED